MRRRRGFTLIEILIVMTVVSILVSIAVPLYQKSMRTVIDEYTFDKKKAPQSLQDLVSEGYLRQIPIDPMTGSDQTWVVVMEDALTSVDQTEPGIYDVRSGSNGLSLEGTPYSEW
mgnify:CR=1 FL=1